MKFFYGILLAVSLALPLARAQSGAELFAKNCASIGAVRPMVLRQGSSGLFWISHRRRHRVLAAV